MRTILGEGINGQCVRYSQCKTFFCHFLCHVLGAFYGVCEIFIVIFRGLLLVGARENENSSLLQLKICIGLFPALSCHRRLVGYSLRQSQL